MVRLLACKNFDQFFFFFLEQAFSSYFFHSIATLHSNSVNQVFFSLPSPLSLCFFSEFFLTLSLSVFVYFLVGKGISIRGNLGLLRAWRTEIEKAENLRIEELIFYDWGLTMGMHLAYILGTIQGIKRWFLDPKS